MRHERTVVAMERQRILGRGVAQNRTGARASLLENLHTVAVSGPAGTRRLRGEVILISTGSKPHRPAEIAFDDVHTFDSDTFLWMDRIPKSLAVIGGGVIGCGFASIFMALGVNVTLVDGRDRLLPFLDAEIADRLRDRFISLGCELVVQRAPRESRKHFFGRPALHEKREDAGNRRCTLRRGSPRRG